MKHQLRNVRINCVRYTEKELTVRRIWWTNNGNVTIATNFKKVYDEREQWIKKLNPEFQFIQKENWPKLEIKIIRMGSLKEVIREDQEKSLKVKSRTGPV